MSLQEARRAGARHHTFQDVINRILGYLGPVASAVKAEVDVVQLTKWAILGMEAHTPVQLADAVASVVEHADLVFPHENTRPILVDLLRQALFFLHVPAPVTVAV